MFEDPLISNSEAELKASRDASCGCAESYSCYLGQLDSSVQLDQLRQLRSFRFLSNTSITFPGTISQEIPFNVGDSQPEKKVADIRPCAHTILM